MLSHLKNSQRLIQWPSWCVADPRDEGVSQYFNQHVLQRFDDDSDEKANLKLFRFNAKIKFEPLHTRTFCQINQ
jgi:hypothetical protein